jgi:hypothetical protein
MTSIHLQALMGHATMDMTREYVQPVDEDLMEAHREHGPVDRFLLFPIQLGYRKLINLW